MEGEREKISFNTVCKVCSECPQCSLLSLFISVVIFAFITGEVTENKFCLIPFFDWKATAMKLLGNLQLPLSIKYVTVTSTWWYVYVSFECCAPLFIKKFAWLTCKLSGFTYIWEKSLVQKGRFTFELLFFLFSPGVALRQQREPSSLVNTETVSH